MRFNRLASMSLASSAFSASILVSGDDDFAESQLSMRKSAKEDWVSWSILKNLLAWEIEEA